MPSDGAYVAAVAVMTAVAFATRVAGAALMSWVVPNARTERFLEGLSVSVIAALVASLLMAADTKTVTATVVAVVMMAITRRVVWAMLAGMGAAAASRLLFAW